MFNVFLEIFILKGNWIELEIRLHWSKISWPVQLNLTDTIPEITQVINSLIALKVLIKVA